MKYLNRGVFYFMLCLQVVSCNTKQEKPISPSTIKEVHLDSDAVLTLKERYDTSKNSIDAVAKLLGLNNIKGENKGEEIRIWFGYALSDSAKVVILKKKKNIWHSEAYFHKYYTDENYNIVSIKKRIEKNEPRSGWPVFLKKLSDFGIYGLKNYQEIPNYASCSDGDQLSVEIWKNGLYNIYEYPCYDEYDDNIKEVKKLTQICLLVQKEFGYKLFPRPK